MKGREEVLKPYNGFNGDQRERGDQILKQAIAEGIIPPPSSQPCVLCGKDKGIRHYHNEDYREENVVADAKVVCWRCHMMIHTRFRHPLSFGKYMIDVTLNHKRFAPVFRGNAWEELEQHYID